MLGVDDYLRKPFAIDKLLESVQNLCPLDSATEDDKNR
jgi:DNA-binding response OmpR family regulator